MSYKIELVPSGVAGARSTMFRGGLKFEVGGPKILDLSKDELEVFTNDWRFKVSSTKDSGETIEETKAALGDALPPADSVTAQEAVVAPSAPVEDTATTQEESVSGEDADVKNLLKDHSREELDSIAQSLGLEGVYANKTEVAQAIVDAR